MAVGMVVGLALWVALVVPLDDAQVDAPVFWWAMVAAAMAMGLVFGGSAGVPAAVALVVVPLVMSPWTAPRGDNDGLWVLWLPLLGFFSVPLAAVAWVGGYVRGVLRRR